jgi:hypothetical protein
MNENGLIKFVNECFNVPPKPQVTVIVNKGTESQLTDNQGIYLADSHHSEYFRAAIHFAESTGGLGSVFEMIIESVTKKPISYSAVKSVYMANRYSIAPNPKTLKTIEDVINVYSNLHMMTFDSTERPLLNRLFELLDTNNMELMFAKALSCFCEYRTSILWVNDQLFFQKLFVLKMFNSGTKKEWSHLLGHMCEIDDDKLLKTLVNCFVEAFIRRHVTELKFFCEPETFCDQLITATKTIPKNEIVDWFEKLTRKLSLEHLSFCAIDETLTEHFDRFSMETWGCTQHFYVRKLRHGFVHCHNMNRVYIWKIFKGLKSATEYKRWRGYGLIYVKPQSTIISFNAKGFAKDLKTNTALAHQLYDRYIIGATKPVDVAFNHCVVSKLNELDRPYGTHKEHKMVDPLTFDYPTNEDGEYSKDVRLSQDTIEAIDFHIYHLPNNQKRFAIKRLLAYTHCLPKSIDPQTHFSDSDALKYLIE